MLDRFCLRNSSVIFLNHSDIYEKWIWIFTILCLNKTYHILFTKNLTYFPNLNSSSNSMLHFIKIIWDSWYRVKHESLINVFFIRNLLLSCFSHKENLEKQNKRISDKEKILNIDSYDLNSMEIFNEIIDKDFIFIFVEIVSNREIVIDDIRENIYALECLILLTKSENIIYMLSKMNSFLDNLYYRIVLLKIKFNNSELFDIYYNYAQIFIRRIFEFIKIKGFYRIEDNFSSKVMRILFQGKGIY